MRHIHPKIHICKQLYAAMGIVFSFWHSENFEVAFISSFMLPLFDFWTSREISQGKLLRKASKQIKLCELVIYWYTRFSEVLVLFDFVLNIECNLSVLFHMDTSILCIMCIEKSKSINPGFDDFRQVLIFGDTQFSYYNTITKP